MKEVTIGYEVNEADEDAIWLYITRSFGRESTDDGTVVNALDSPIHLLLRWIIEQINFGCWLPRFDENGDGVTLILGREAANTFESVECAKEYAEKRIMALNIATLFAIAREAGTDAANATLIETQRFSAVSNPPNDATIAAQIDAHHPANAWPNTELAYAFRLVEVLGNLREWMFAFQAPPIHRSLPAHVSQQLAEATRAYFYGLNRAAIALCRAILDAALQHRITENELERHERQVRTANGGFRRKGDLECRIGIARQTGLLATVQHSQAHELRKLGNEVMHDGEEASDHDAWQALRKIRFILEDLCQPPAG